MADAESDLITVGSQIPYVQYLVKAWEIFSALYGLGKDEVGKAIAELQRDVAVLKQRVDELERRVVELENEFKLAQNLARFRLTRKCFDDATVLAFQLNRDPDVDELATIAKSAGLLAVRMFDDPDQWYWSDVRPIKPQPKEPPFYEVLQPAFKGLPLPAFALAVTVFALAAAAHLRQEPGARSSYADVLARLREATSLRPDWVEKEGVPYTLPELFRSQILVEALAATKYVTNGQCGYRLECVNAIERTRSFVRNLTLDADPNAPSNTLCMAPGNLGVFDETVIEDDYPPIKTLAVLEDMVDRIASRGTLADPPPTPLFSDESPATLALYAVDATGQMFRFTCDTTTYVRSPSWRRSASLGGGWGTYTHVVAGYENVLYAVRADGSIWWYRHDGASDGSPRWTGPRQVAPAETMLGRVIDGYVGGSRGQIYTIGRNLVGGGGITARFKVMLSVRQHSGFETGSGGFAKPETLSYDWPSYKAVFGGTDGVLYGLTDGGDLMWHGVTRKATGWQLTGPTRIGWGWNMYRDVFASGGFLYGILPNGKMNAYYYRTWRHGPAGGKHPWTAAIPVPGPNWNAYRLIVPVLEERTAVVN